MRNRWLLALCAVGIHISIGSIYAWSQIAESIQQQVGADWGLGEITITFTIAICALGLAAAFMGHFVDRRGPRTSGILAAVCFGLGLVGAGLALQLESLWLLYLSYGLLGGIGIGIGYITPVSTLLKWFPDRRGLATGMTIMGFGFGAAIEVTLLQSVFPLLGIQRIAAALPVLGIIYFVLMLGCSLYLAPPPSDWQPEAKATARARRKPKMEDLESITAKTALTRVKFYSLWLMLFINVCCGIALIAVAKMMGREVILLSSAAAALMVMLMSIFNGLGRIFWASASDYLTRPLTYVLFFGLQIGAFLILTGTTNAILFQVMVCLILSCYGGGFSVIPAYIGDVFGTREAGAIHGYILTAWAAAGIVGPMLIAFTRQMTGSYHGALLFLTALLAVALVIALLTMGHVRRRQRHQTAGA